MTWLEGVDVVLLVATVVSFLFHDGFAKCASKIGDRSVTPRLLSECDVMHHIMMVTSALLFTF